MQYLLRVKDGRAVAQAIDGEITSLEQVIGRVKILSRQKFKIDDRHFTYTTYGEVGSFIHVIHCQFLKWRTSLMQKGDNFEIRRGKKTIVNEVFLKDVTIRVFPRTKRVDGLAYISNGQSEEDAIQLCNIWDDGKICAGQDFLQRQTPPEIIRMIESSRGNSDLSIGSTTLIEDKKYGHVVMTPQIVKGNLSNKCRNLTL